ncbi:hypothetical protein Z946_2881 [Sulfitobacter noctilucicola]|uniref:Uncharacterized protein n=1 Tax=Sulfitobacter noctilucicola TaxID=1342301 RepID=A0A7W6MAB0_9RHOB|nr:hypothetical protein [Sulfitobacter noctilucicola]KIN63998.1 hypothetical protein Z946_2881 [Sulfitobacter noctilucicola]MBB4175354.1 hypothetical protein [Sulfitobacter noctilucicola]
MRAGIGHNQGPTMERGQKWRSFQWQKARDAAMPKAVPLMVVKMHVARARQLGLDYPTYAAVRKATGRDIMGLLFSSNALRVVRAEAPQMPLDRSDAIEAVSGARKLALVHAPIRAEIVQQTNPVLDHVGVAPKFTDSWSAMRAHLGGIISDQRLARDQVLVIGDTGLERDWAPAAQAAGYIEAARYFP